MTRVRVDFSGLERFTVGMRRTSPGSPIGQMWRQIGIRYLTFTRRRFTRMSKGGWPALAPATLRNRRGRKRRATRSPRAQTKTTTRGSATNVAILRDTSTMFNALTVGMPGNRLQLIRRRAGGVRVGFGGPAKHPNARKATIREIAAAHDTGKGRLPKREILVEPDGGTVATMRQDVIRAITKLGRESER